jgi:hypothetical protein
MLSVNISDLIGGLFAHVLTRYLHALFAFVLIALIAGARVAKIGPFASPYRMPGRIPVVNHKTALLADNRKGLSR